MTRQLAAVLVFVPVLCSCALAQCDTTEQFTLLLHGGGGTGWDKAAKQNRKKEVMARSLEAGSEVLRKGGTAVDAVEVAVRTMEDAPVYNAGRGGIPNKGGFVELDASIMEGKTKNAGAVAAVRTIKNPITAAKTAMEKSEHLMFVGRGADNFAKSMGLETRDPEWFLHAGEFAVRKSKHGTVGAVALDRCGDLAAGTSTGGFNSKTPGRVGDSPVIGAGTYADSAVCGVSATGHGEYFIRYAAAYDVCALMKYKGLGVEEAGSEVIHGTLKPAGGIGGFIAIDPQGRMAWPYSSKGMLRGYVKEDGKMFLGIYEEMQEYR